MAQTTIRDNVAIGEPDLLIAASPNGSQNYSVMSLGAFATSGDGRGFRFAYDGGTALVPGALYQAPIQVTGDENLTSTGNIIGDTLVVLGASLTIASDALAGGSLVVRKGTGQGNTYQILSNLACTSAACNITLADAIRVATDSSSVIDVYPANPYKGVVINPTTATSAPVGAAIIATAGTQYAWLQVEGVIGLQNDGASTINPGQAVAASVTTAGTVTKFLAGTTPYIVGVAMTTISGTNWGLVKLSLG